MRQFIMFAALALSACTVDEPVDLSSSTHTLGDPLLEALEALPGVTVTELPPRPDARQFMLLVTQPVDHMKPNGETFQQRVVIRSRGVELPTALASTGYGLFGSSPRDSEVSFWLEGNAITVEHRYYEGSVPESADPKYLNIRQAAADHHHIVELLRPIYTGKWISTGASKGGMTSIYHRRYYPNDVDATVAYVAPQSYTTNDPRYGHFLEHVGSETCRQRIIDTQRMFLDRRAELIPIFEAQAAELGYTYDHVGGLPLVFEHSVAEFRFALWQYFDEAFCAELPTAADPADLVALYLDFVSGPGILGSDQTLAEFGAYYYQSATQLGSYGPLALERHIRSRLENPGTYRVEAYSTLPITNVDRFSVPEVQLWLATRGERVMFIYGENDPWSAGAFELGWAKDSFRYFVPGGNHGSAISTLPDTERDAAFATLARWAGVELSGQARKTRKSVAVEDWGIDRERRLPL